MKSREQLADYYGLTDSTDVCSYACHNMNDLDISRGFDAGNYASAYETTDYGHAIASLSPNRSEAYHQAFTLGFFATYDLDEMGPHAEDYLAALRSPAGQRCTTLGYVEECV